MGWTQGTVVERKAWTERHISLRIDASFGNFQPGQFVRLGLEVDGEIVGRPYSLVNAPADPLLEIYFDVVPTGPLSPRLAALAPGDRVLVGTAAYGFLVLSEMPAGSELWLIASGTGIGPFVSIVGDGTLWRHYDHLRLVHGVRHAAELAYAERLQAVTAPAGKGCRYLPLLSRESRAGTLSGRIPAAIADSRLQRAAGLSFDPARSRVMLCGNPAMVEDTMAALAAYGLGRHRRRSPGQILIEEYWSRPA
ncbi:MAG: ferredoxin--NADP reductase [Rhodocyclaceae bacterium]|nr:ferredoxin--NADP reductase [Rhodocyclaceae bacterium]